jgi:hypothetical protein
VKCGTKTSLTSSGQEGDGDNFREHNKRIPKSFRDKENYLTVSYRSSEIHFSNPCSKALNNK